MPLVLLVGALLPGCPIYGNGDEGCLSDSQCARGYACDGRSGRCSRADTCNEPSDCSRNETCSRESRCVVGDCTFSAIGCVSGYVCGKPRGVWECVRKGGADGGTGGSAAQAGASSDPVGGEGGDVGAGGAGTDAPN